MDKQMSCFNKAVKIESIRNYGCCIADVDVIAQ